MFIETALPDLATNLVNNTLKGMETDHMRGADIREVDPLRTDGLTATLEKRKGMLILGHMQGLERDVNQETLNSHVNILGIPLGIEVANSIGVGH